VTGHCYETKKANSIGELQSVDGYMNIALEKTAEYVNGQKRRDYGDAFVRGNNGKCLVFLH
jgi:U6 snRNA-associated Sm-like protein LSm6